MAEVNVNNNTTICGKLSKDFTLSHMARGEAFYINELAVQRSSGVFDIIPITVSGRLTDINNLKMGDCVEVTGQMRSLIKKELARNPVYLFAVEIAKIENGDTWKNDSFLRGIIFSKKELHKTQSGREAINIRILADRKYGRSDCISCVLWGRNARYADTLNIGTPISIRGRVQSRVYRPATDTEDEKRCIEISVYQIDQDNINITGKSTA